VITRVAGTTGVPSDLGDGGPATEAGLNLPMGLAMFADGSFLIADIANHEVRQVSPDGVINLFAGMVIDGDLNRPTAPSRLPPTVRSSSRTQVIT
jgi:hypothetical protein